MKLCKSREGRNRLIYIAIYLLINIAYGLCATEYLQAYMLESGLSMGMVGIYGTVSQTAALLAYALYPRCKKNGGEHRFFCRMSMLYALYPLMYAVSGLFSSPTAIFLFMAGGACLLSGVGGFRSTSEFALTPSLFPRTQYAQVIGWGGILGGGVALAFSLLGMMVFDSKNIYTLFFLTAGVCTIGTALLAPRYRCDATAEQSQNGMSFAEMFQKLSSRKYIALFFPHLIRGIAMGGMYYILAVTLPNVEINSALLVPATVCGTMLANWMFLFLSRHIPARGLIVAVNGICAVCMVVLPLARAAWLYLGIYILYYISKILSENTVPMGVLRSTSQADLPFVSSIRMLCTSTASALTTLTLAPLAEKLPVGAIPVFAAIIFVITSLLYARQFDDRYE